MSRAEARPLEFIPDRLLLKVTLDLCDMSVQIRRVRVIYQQLRFNVLGPIMSRDVCGRNYADRLELDALSFTLLFTLSLPPSLFSFFMTCPSINVLNKTLLLRCARQ